MTPVTGEKGALFTLRLGREVLEERGAPDEVKNLFEQARFFTPSYGLILALARRMPEYKPPLNRWMDREGLGGIYVEGAYFYSFEPRSFIPGVTP